MDVTIFAGDGSGTWTWSFEGDVSTLCSLWTRGVAPVHLNPNWGEEIDAPGTVKPGGEDVPDVAIMVDGPGEATLYIGDDAFAWGETATASTSPLEAVEDASFDVMVVAAKQKYRWVVGGPEEQFVSWFEAGQIPMHLHPNWTGDTIAVEGHFEALTHTIAAEVQLHIHGPESAKLYVEDREYEWTPAGVELITTEVPPDIRGALGPLTGTQQVAGITFTDGAIRELAPTESLHPIRLLAALEDGCLDQLEALHLGAHPLNSELVAALLSRPRPNLRMLMVVGDWTAGLNDALGASLSYLHVKGAVQVWPHASELIANSVPSSPAPSSMHRLTVIDGLTAWPPELVYVAASVLPKEPGPPSLRDVHCGGALKRWPPSVVCVRAASLPEGPPPETVERLVVAGPLAAKAAHRVDIPSIAIEAPSDKTVADLSAAPILVRRLALARGTISTQGGHHLALVLKDTPLDYLDVTRNQIGARGIAALNSVLKSQVAFLRADNAAGVAIGDDFSHREWLDWDLLYDFIHKLLNEMREPICRVFELAGGNHQTVRRAFGHRDLEKAWRAVPRALKRGMPKHWAKAAKGTTEHTVHGLVTELVDGIVEMNAGVFEGAMGNDYPPYVGYVAEKIPVWSGTAIAWRGDGHEQPVTDVILSQRLADLASSMRGQHG
jgi:hypothetical protein